MPRTCPWCKQPFEIPPGKKGGMKYHPKCRIEMRNAKQRKYHRKRAKKSIKPNNTGNGRLCKAVENNLLNRHARGCSGYCDGENHFYSTACWTQIRFNQRGDNHDGEAFFQPSYRDIQQFYEQTDQFIEQVMFS